MATRYSATLTAVVLRIMLVSVADLSQARTPANVAVQPERVKEKTSQTG
jgi:hypothetical protein